MLTILVIAVVLLFLIFIAMIRLKGSHGSGSWEAVIEHQTLILVAVHVMDGRTGYSIRFRV